MEMGRTSQFLWRHPDCRGFISQAGRASMQESLYNEVRAITFPILGDQDFNAHCYDLLGTSISLDIVGITEEALKGVISKLLHDESYKKRSLQLSQLAKDVPVKSPETAVWWTEFLIRHDQEELSLLKPFAISPNWLIKRSLDVWLLVLLITLIGIWLAYLVFKKILSRLCKTNEPRKTKPTKDKKS